MKSSLHLQTCTPFDEENSKKIKTIWQSLQGNNDSFEFRKPVDYKSMGLHNYPEYVKNPMDLSTIHRKLKENRYIFIEEVLDDIQLIWDNCKTYNQSNAWIYNLADRLQKSFKKMVKNYLPSIDFGQNQIISRFDQAAKPKKEQVLEENEDEEQQVAYQSKLLFIDKLKLLPPEKLAELINKINQVCPPAYKTEDEKHSMILIDKLDIESFRKVYEATEELTQYEKTITKKLKI